MASPSKNAGCSPSSGPESYTGTPKDAETRLKTFSPNILSQSASEHLEFAFDSTNFLSVGAQGVNKTQGFMDKDPFISTKVKVGQKLSPTASTFHPYALRIAPQVMNYPIVVSSGFQPHSKVQAPFDGKSGITMAISSTESSMTAGPASPTDSQGSSGITQLGIFSTDTIVTRALSIRSVSGIHVPVTANLVETCVMEGFQPSGTIKYVRFGNDVLVRFSDIGDATDTYNYARMNHLEWSVEYITPAIFSEKVNPKKPLASAHEGQVLLVATFPKGGGFDRAKLEGIMLDMLAVDGVIYAYQKQLAAEAGTLRLIVEYSDVNSATRAVERLRGTVIRGIKISINCHTPDLESLSASHQPVPETPTRGRNRLVNALSHMSIADPANSQHAIIESGYTAFLSPTGRSLIPARYPTSPTFSTMPLTFGGQCSAGSNAAVGYPPSGIHFSHSYPGQLHSSGAQIAQITAWDGMGGPRSGQARTPQLGQINGKRQNTFRNASRNIYANGQSGQHNVVDIGKIRDGIDVRTTIMLRNIPNKVDQETLKSIVDETSHGCYDFMYLRIDFANSCNVGYAFINFDDPWHIINFVSTRAGQRWNKFSSDKVAEVSYATIQGKDCLIQKFRNSSVMLEHPSYRPKIFFTTSHPRAGEEDDFPPPDNPSKMRRSVENAEHVGLFAPRSGQRNRDEQRDHHSQYDRGTRLAALEEIEYDPMVHDYGSSYIF